MGKKIDLMPCPHCGGEKCFIDNNGLGQYGDPPDAFGLRVKHAMQAAGRGETVKKQPQTGIAGHRQHNNKNFV